MQKNVQFFCDRSPVSVLSESAKEIITRNSLLSTGSSLVSFCGIFLEKNNIICFLPRNFPIDQEQYSPESLARMVLSAITLYCRENESAVYGPDEVSEAIGINRLVLIRQLLDDYRQYGLYKRKTKVSVMNYGKPDWARTIVKSIPFISKMKKNHFFLDVIGRRSTNVSDSDIARIQASIIKKLDEEFSWLFYGKSIFNDYDLFSSSHENLDIKYQLFILRKELKNLYSNRDILLLSNMIQYLEKFSATGQSSMIIGVKGVHNVWEYMLRNVLEHSVSLNRKLPAPAYRIAGGELVKVASKGQRTDIILQNTKDKVLVVIDAKYYDASSTANSPGWPDLVKQFFYARALKTIYPDYEIKNIFIFPGQGDFLRSAHMVDRKNETLLDIEYPAVLCKYVCPLDVLIAFTSRKKMKTLSDELLSVDNS